MKRTTCYRIKMLLTGSDDDGGSGDVFVDQLLGGRHILEFRLDVFAPGDIDSNVALQRMRDIDRQGQ